MEKNTIGDNNQTVEENTLEDNKTFALIGTIAHRWRLLCGHENRWHGMLAPMDSDLQRLLIHYGAMAQSTYDAFLNNPQSKYNGLCRYSRRNYFTQCGMVEGNPFPYSITKYIYSSAVIGIPFIPDPFIEKTQNPPAPDLLPEKTKNVGTFFSKCNWIGFIAVSTDEASRHLGRRDICIAFRGSQAITEWVKDLEFPLVPALELAGWEAKVAPNVHSGFLSMYNSRMPHSHYSYNSAREQIIIELRRLMAHHHHEELTITMTGHSMGASIAKICAVDIAASDHKITTCYPHRVIPVTVFAFGCPRTGDIVFKHALETCPHISVLRIENLPDPVPKVPMFPGYVHSGENKIINNLVSPYLHFPLAPQCWHNLEVAYLHPIAIENGAKGLRSLACVNKHSAALNNSYKIPIYWWKVCKKGMIQLSNGVWVLHEHEAEHEHDHHENELIAVSKM